MFLSTKEKAKVDENGLFSLPSLCPTEVCYWFHAAKTKKKTPGIHTKQCCTYSTRTLTSTHKNTHDRNFSNVVRGISYKKGRYQF